MKLRALNKLLVLTLLALSASSLALADRGGPGHGGPGGPGHGGPGHGGPGGPGHHGPGPQPYPRPRPYPYPQPRPQPYPQPRPQPYPYPQPRPQPYPYPQPYPPQYRTDDVRCESNSDRYDECNTTLNDIQRIELIRQESHAPCYEGNSFGINGRRVWVDRGCRGIFRVWGY